jgi:hypothetical protein
MLKRYLIPIAALFLGSTLIAGVYFGILTWAQGWDSALNIFLPNRWYLIPIWISFGVQAAPRPVGVCLLWAESACSSGQGSPFTPPTGTIIMVSHLHAAASMRAPRTRNGSSAGVCLRFLMIRGM